MPHEMQNVETNVVGDILTIKVDLSKDFGKSSTGKTTIVASSKGTQQIAGTTVKLGLNIFRK